MRIGHRMQSVYAAVCRYPGRTIPQLRDYAFEQPHRWSWVYRAFYRAYKAGLIERRAHPDRNDWSVWYPKGEA